MREKLQQLAPYRDRIIITAIALVLAILLLTIGFWRTLLIVIITGIGFVIGTYKDGALGQLVNSFWGMFGNR